MSKLDRDTVNRIADLLDECVDCFKIHQYQKLHGQWTWADPNDGHSYRKRSTVLTQTPGYVSLTEWIRGLE